MVLNFTTIDREGKCKDFSWWFSNLDFSLDALSSASVKENRIIKAEIVDNQDRIQLPVTVFDGNQISRSLRSLESQWQEVLKKPVAREQIRIKLPERKERSIREERNN